MFQVERRLLSEPPARNCRSYGEMFREEVSDADCKIGGSSEESVLAF